MNDDTQFDENYVFATDEVWRVSKGFTVPLKLPMTHNKKRIITACFETATRYRGVKSRPDFLRSAFRTGCRQANNPEKPRFPDGTTFISGRIRQTSMTVNLTPQMHAELLEAAKIVVGPSTKDLQEFIFAALKRKCFLSDRRAYDGWIFDPIHPDDRFDEKGNYLNDPRNPAPR